VFAVQHEKANERQTPVWGGFFSFVQFALVTVTLFLQWDIKTVCAMDKIQEKQIHTCVQPLSISLVRVCYASKE